MERLNKHIASLGICSRRNADELIANKKVKINGKIVDDLSTKVDPDNDIVEVIGHDKKSIKEKLVYILLNKPTDYICSNTDSQGSSVLELLTEDNYSARAKRKLMQRVYPVGRLDKDSEGLVLLTNDGELANRLTHPRFKHGKEYEVIIDQRLTPQAREILTSGMHIGHNETVGGIEILEAKQRGRRFVITVILREGKNRQIRKMFGQLGYRITSLRRTRIAKAKLGVLPIGQWKFIEKDRIV